MSDSIWHRNLSVYVTSFWGWRPSTWGNVGFTGEARRETIIRETTDPFIMVIYVTTNAPKPFQNLQGLITGFYEVEHVSGHRDQFTDPVEHSLEPAKWQFGLKARRAFDFLPEYRLSMKQLDPTSVKRGQAISQWSEELSADKVAILRQLPFQEVPVYGGSQVVDPAICLEPDSKYMNRAGPPNRSGYFVPGEPIDTPKELYVLALEGDTNAYLGGDSQGRSIYKIGMSLSPSARCKAFQESMPRGAFGWRIERTTRRDGDDPYPGYGVALAGENAMKESLGRSGKWLGGEFYLATREQLEEAWDLGKVAAIRAGNNGGATA